MGKTICLILLFYLAVINIVTFFLFGIDKHRAARQAWRIRERTLFLCAFLGGSIGAMLGMRRFHHKTRHASLVIGIPAILIGQLLLGAALLILR